MNKDEKELINQLKEDFYQYEEPYEEGNWEQFQQRYGAELKALDAEETRKVVSLWRYYSAAAVIIGLLFWATWNSLNNESVHQEELLTESNLLDKEHKIFPEPKHAELSSNLESKTLYKAPEFTLTIRKSQDAENILAEEEGPLKEIGIHDEEKIALAPITEENKLVITSEDQEIIQAKDTKESQLAATFPVEPPKLKEYKWKFGVEVNPTWASDKPSLSAGVITQYELTKKVKLSAGLTYAYLSATHQNDPVQLAFNSRQMEAESTIKALDIPLSIVFEPKEGWYASIGVSAFAVLDEQKRYRMETEMLKENVVTDAESGTTFSVFEVVTNNYYQSSAETDFEGKRNLGFLNFSVGRKMEMAKQLDLHVEPFVKFPMGGLQRKDINLINSGVKIKILF